MLASLQRVVLAETGSRVFKISSTVWAGCDIRRCQPCFPAPVWFAAGVRYPLQEERRGLEGRELLLLLIIRVFFDPPEAFG